MSMRLGVASVLVLATLVTGCDDLFQPLDPGQSSRLPPNAPERLRLFVPVDVIPVGELSSIQVERVARQGDGAPTQPLCVELGLTGPGGILSADGMSTSSTVRFDLPRGSTASWLLRSDQSGLAILRGRLLTQTCDAAPSASALTDVMREVRFARIGDVPIEEDAGL